MEGINENLHSEKISESTEHADVVTEESTKESGTLTLTLTHPVILDNTSILFLEAILPSIVGCNEVWPQKLLTAVIERFGRMPRNEWTSSRAYFNNKFQTNIPPDVFKKKEQEALVISSGRPCSSRQYKRDPVNRVKTIDEHIEERILSETKIFNELKVKSRKLLANKFERLCNEKSRRSRNRSD